MNSPGSIRQPCFYILIRTRLKNTDHKNWFFGFETTRIILLSIGQGLVLKYDFLHVEVLLNISCCIRINEQHSLLSRLLLIRRHQHRVAECTSSSPDCTRHFLSVPFKYLVLYLSALLFSPLVLRAVQ